MNSLSALSPLLPPLVPRAETPAPAFRFPRHMHVPAKVITLDFLLEPDWAWIPRSFITWLRRPLAQVPNWML